MNTMEEFIMNKNFSRRTFLKGAAISTLGLATFGMGGMAFAEAADTTAPAAEPKTVTEVPYIEQTVAQIAQNLYCISEFYLVNTYLLVGEEKAFLFDTGCGIGNIREIVERITDKPITVMLTHGHFDHSGGLYHFAHDCDVYMHPADLNQTTGNNMYREMYASTRAEVRFPGPENLAGMLARIPAEEPEQISLEITKPLKGGDVFDVGGSTVTVYETPGHTPGSVAFLIEPQRFLVSGDTLNNSVILARQPNNGTALIEEFNQTCRNLWKIADKFDYLAVGHDGFAWEKNLIKDYIDLSQGLLDGYITGKYLEFGIRAGDMARLRTAELWYQCDK